MKIPTIHLNGDSKETLLANYEKAGQAIAAAFDALGETRPNGRNFYPQGDGVLNEATMEHERRMTKLREIYSELAGILIAISDGRTE